MPRAREAPICGAICYEQNSAADIVRSGFLGLTGGLRWRLFSGLMLACAFAACGGDNLQRFESHTRLASGEYESDRRITATITPGSALSSCSDPASTSDICLRASGPLPRFRVANGRAESITLQVELENVGADLVFVPSLAGLFDDEAQSDRCVEESLGPDGDWQVLGAARSGPVIELTLSPCSAWVFYTRLPDDATEYRVAVVGAIDSDRGALETMVEDINAWAPDYVQFMGNLEIARSSDAITTLATVAAELNAPYGVAIGPGDVRTRRDPTAFIETFGQLDYATTVGHVRWLVLDSADRELTETQFQLVDGLGDCESGGCGSAIAWMHVPPVSPGRVDRDTFVSDHEAHRLLNLLAEHGVERIVSAASRDLDIRRMQVAELVDVPTIREDTQPWVRLTITRPWTSLTPCFDTLEPLLSSTITGNRSDSNGCEVAGADGDTCFEGFCRSACDDALSPCLGLGEVCGDRGYCEIECTGDEACPGPVPTCLSGICERTPVFAFSAISTP